MDKLMHGKTFSYWGKKWLEMNEYNFSLSYHKTAEIQVKGINKFIGNIKIENITPFHKVNMFAAKETGSFIHLLLFEVFGKVI